MPRLLALLLPALLTAGPATGAEWYRGNTHAHTVLCGHADSTPEQVALWYLEHGYHFLVLSEHNRYIDPDSVALPARRRTDFILIPGEEVSGSRHVHSTAFNTRHLVDWDSGHDDKTEIIQFQVDGARAAGGQSILNHPNWQWSLTVDDIRPVRSLRLFELYNGHPHVRTWGDGDHPSTEAMWDSLLTAGKRLYGVGSDDAHHFQTLSPGHSNPGRGWVMVRADTLSADDITRALLDGDFYASSGVFLSRLERAGGAYEIEVDGARTLAEINAGRVTGRPVEAGEALEPGFRIEFIGGGGRVLRSVRGKQARLRRPAHEAYVRGRVSYTRVRQDGRRERFYAWGQPVFVADPVGD